MSTWDEYSGYYCLLIAIFCNLDVTEAQMMYDYGPEHPICQKFLKRKIHLPEIEKLKVKDTGKWMQELRQNGYTIDEIANAFGCFPSTVKRRIQKIECEQKEERDALA